jgi:hypothetical protein
MRCAVQAWFCAALAVFSFLSTVGISSNLVQRCDALDIYFHLYLLS